MSPETESDNPTTEKETPRGAATPLTDRRAMCIFIMLIALIASLISASLIYSSLSGHAAGCTTMGGDCDSLLASQFGNFLGLPISIPGCAIYLFMLFSAWRLTQPLAPSTALKYWLGIATAAFAALLTGAWFFYVQLFVMHAFCPFCCMVHACGLLICVVLLIAGLQDQRRRTPHISLSGFVSSKFWYDVQFTLSLAVVGIIILITAQNYFPVVKDMMTWQKLGGVRDTDSGAGPQREISILAGRVRFRPHEMPALGDPDAPYVMVYLYDYTCPGCRAVHRWLQQARARYGSQLVIVTLPVPLNSQCNPMISKTLPRHVDACELAKLALMLWHEAPEKFDAFDAFLIDGSVPPTPAEAREKIVALIGAERMKKAMLDPWPAQQITRNVQLLKLTGEGAIPRIILGPLMITATPRSADILCQILEKETGIKPANSGETSTQPAATQRQ